MLERFNQELKRRTHVVRIFPNGESCLRLVQALAVETHENWLESPRKRSGNGAYSIWENEGRPEGQHESHWLRAEAEIDFPAQQAKAEH